MESYVIGIDLGGTNTVIGLVDAKGTILEKDDSVKTQAHPEIEEYTDAVAAQLENEIQQISIGRISVFDPTTGIYSPLQIVVDNLYNSSRENALTASEYDALELTATAYDAYQLTATDYDRNGKELLV